jgi:hypothetical protein
MSYNNWFRVAAAAWALLAYGLIYLWPEHVVLIQMTLYSIGVIGFFLSRVLLFKRRKRFWWALVVPLIVHIFVLAKIEKFFPFRNVLVLFYVVVAGFVPLLLAAVVIFGVTKKNPLVPDASLPEAMKQNEIGAP